MKKTLMAFALLMLSSGWLMAQNPIIRDQFSADPTARVFNGRVYPRFFFRQPYRLAGSWCYCFSGECALGKS